MVATPTRVKLPALMSEVMALSESPLAKEGLTTISESDGATSKGSPDKKGKRQLPWHTPSKT